MKTNVHPLSYLAQFFLEWKMFRTKVVEKIETHILCLITFFFKGCRLWDNVETCKAGQATDNNMARIIYLYYEYWLQYFFIVFLFS